MAARTPDNDAKERNPATRDQVVQMMADSFAAVRTNLELLRPGALMAEVDMFGRPRSRRAILTFLDTHLAEHVGQAIAYARMNGITPPWSTGERK